MNIEHIHFIYCFFLIAIPLDLTPPKIPVLYLPKTCIFSSYDILSLAMLARMKEKILKGMEEPPRFVKLKDR